MTNIDRAARILHDLAAKESAEDGFPKPQWEAEPVWEKNVWLGVAQALADTGLLMPDLPEPTEPEGGKWEADEDVYVVDMSSSSLAEEDRLPGYVALVLKWSDEVKIQVMSAEVMRRVGLCLLAAADYAERNQE